MYDVCYVNEQGELKCGSTAPPYRSLYESDIKPAIQTAQPGISPQRLSLIMRLIEQVMQSPLDDACIDTRSDDTVGSVQDVLATTAPLMLLYRYYSLPGDILAAYYVQQGDYDQARGALDHWAPPLKAGC